MYTSRQQRRRRTVLGLSRSAPYAATDALLATHTAIPHSTSTIPANLRRGRSAFSPRHRAVTAVKTNVSALHTGTAMDMSAGRGATNDVSTVGKQGWIKGDAALKGLFREWGWEGTPEKKRRKTSADRRGRCLVRTIQGAWGGSSENGNVKRATSFNKKKA